MLICQIRPLCVTSSQNKSTALKKAVSGIDKNGIDRFMESDNLHIEETVARLKEVVL